MSIVKHRNILFVLLCLLYLTSTSFAAQESNYHKIANSNFALILQDFDAIAPQPGSSEFVKVSSSGGIAPKFLLKPALQNGWNVSFTDQDIKTGALLVFSNNEKQKSLLALATKDTTGLTLKYYQNSTAATASFTNIADVEEKLGYSFIGAINPAKHIVNWGSTTAYSAYYSPPHFSYAANLYGKYSGKIKLSDGLYGFTEIFGNMADNGMPATDKVQELKIGAIVNLVGDGAPKTDNGGIAFVTFVDLKNELVYYTYWSDKPFMHMLTFREMKQRMKMAILPQKELSSPLIF